MHIEIELADGTYAIATLAVNGMETEGFAPFKFQRAIHPGFWMVRWWKAEHLWGTELALRIACTVSDTRIEGDGPLKFRHMAIVDDAERNRASKSILPWVYQASESSSGYLTLVSGKSNNELHEIPEGNTRSFWVAFIGDESKAPNNLMESLLRRSRTRPDEHSVFGISRERMNKRFPWDINRTLELGKPTRLGMEGLDAYVPYGGKQGDEPGGDGIQITPWEEVVATPMSLEYCLTMMLRQACRIDTVAYRRDTGNPVDPSYFSDLHSFDAGAGTSDQSRLPHLNEWPAALWNTGSSPEATANLKQYKQFDDEHASRGWWGCIGLLEHLDPTCPIWHLAYYTFWERASVLWMEIPHVPARGANLPGLLRKTVAGEIRKGWLDRDEGWSLFAAAILWHYSQRQHPANQMGDWLKAWKEVYKATILDNGMPQSVGRGERSWSSNPWLPDANGNRLQGDERAAYSFQAAIILVATYVADAVCETADLLSQREDAAVFLARNLVPSGSHAVNGGKIGPPNIVAVESPRGWYLTPNSYWGGGEITNCLALFTVCGFMETAMLLLGRDLDAESALSIIEGDTRQGYSGSLKWSAMLADHLLERGDLYLPVRPVPEPEPEPENPQPEPSDDEELSRLRAANKRLAAENRRLELLLLEIHNLSE